MPYSADVPEAIDKKIASSLSRSADRIEKASDKNTNAADRNEATTKRQEELTGLFFEMIYNDDGSIKDIFNVARVQESNKTFQKHRDCSDSFLAEILKSIPRSIKAQLSDEDRENFLKQYRQWHIGQWQQDIAYRASLRRANSLDRLKRLYEDRE